MTRKKMTQRRDDLFAALERMRYHNREAGIMFGFRAANPDKHDTEEMRDKEAFHAHAAIGAQGEAVKHFNAAARAARRLP